MLRKQVEKIEKRTGRMIAATTTALQSDQEHAENTKCEHCGKKGLEFIEEYKGRYIRSIWRIYKEYIRDIYGIYIYIYMLTSI